MDVRRFTRFWRSNNPLSKSVNVTYRQAHYRVAGFIFHEIFRGSTAFDDCPGQEG